jgi:hypothetical protein
MVDPFILFDTSTPFDDKKVGVLDEIVSALYGANQEQVFFTFSEVLYILHYICIY